MAKRIDITGQTFGKLTVIRYSHTSEKRYEAFYLCKCECGTETTVTYGHLSSGHTRSCGCLQIEVITERSEGNTWGRKYQNPQEASARTVWQCAYADGCSLEKFLELSQLTCHYCGAAPSNRFNKYLTKEGKLTNEDVSVEWAEQAYFVYNGLDRVDSSLPHNEDNIVSCCIDCNRAKHTMSREKFLKWIERAYNHSVDKTKTTE